MLSAVDTVESTPVTIPADYEAIYRLEAEILKQPQVETPTEHAFCSGMYARTMHIPAGTVATGAVHRKECFFVVRHGTLVIATETGPQTLEAGSLSVTKPGTKRAVVALTDVTVTTFHPNPDDETDLQQLWNTFTVPVDELVSFSQPALHLENGV